MIRAHDGRLTIDDIKQINWNVHLGDIVIARGDLERKTPTSFLLAITSIEVVAAWSESHPNEFFDHMRFSSLLPDVHFRFTSPT